ncbi:MAG TPA: protoporphyrinogen oxidase [Gemmataceae bacterium]|jgi:oxygen-dependent protoporphyrinogen oxidase|nr:protoporphyrinogen oxidase [Gemmataceae bacterium]
MARIVIVGAGISGLALAFGLRRLVPDADITILESASRPGGKIWTERAGGFQVEIGPNGFLDNKSSTVQLCRDLGLENELIPASDSSRRNRFLFLNEQLRALPTGPLSLLTSPLLTWRGKFGLLSECIRPSLRNSVDESVAQFAERRAGKEVANVFADALATGIHGGDPQLLSLKAAFPRVAEMEAKHGSVIRGFLAAARQRRKEARTRGEAPQPARMWSFRAGLCRLMEALTEQLAQAPVLGISVRGIARTQNGEPGWIIRGPGQESWDTDVVVLTCPAPEQARILREFDPALAEEIAAIPYNRIAVVALGYRKSDVPNVPDGFGYIAPQQSRRDLLGVQWCSAIFTERAPQGHVMWRALCGGWHRPEVVDWDDNRLLTAVRDELRLAQGVTASPVFHHIHRWPVAIPQYHVGHLQRLARIESQLTRHPGLFLAGNAYHGVALNDCTEQADILAGRIRAFLALPASGG